MIASVTLIALSSLVGLNIPVDANAENSTLLACFFQDLDPATAKEPVLLPIGKSKPVVLVIPNKGSESKNTLIYDPDDVLQKFDWETTANNDEKQVMGIMFKRDDRSITLAVSEPVAGRESRQSSIVESSHDKAGDSIRASISQIGGCNVIQTNSPQLTFDSYVKAFKSVREQ